MRESLAKGIRHVRRRTANTAHRQLGEQTAAIKKRERTGNERLPQRQILLKRIVITAVCQHRVIPTLPGIITESARSVREGRITQADRHDTLNPTGAVRRHTCGTKEKRDANPRA